MPSIWTAISASVRGNWHEQSGQKNQDSVRLAKPRTAADALLIAVSDGHGSLRSFRSDRGSALATECALRLLKNFVRRTAAGAPLSRVRSQAQKKWPGDLIAAWKHAVRTDLAQNPFSPVDFAAFPDAPPVIKANEEPPPAVYLAYGATLIAAAVTRRYVFYAQLGDGDILTVGNDGTVSRPLQRKHQFYANETASLCSYHALREFQVRVAPVRTGMPALIMLSTDGYANCFGNDGGFFSVGADLLTYLRQHGAVFVHNNLARWLRESSRDGSGDDISVGLGVRMAALGPQAS
ncbi:MAG TPA: PP2C family serine/threonine-protein phosphatase [Candidatus Methylacidiphilales bacterium]|nr:PP2C family serine/threonine-protein phosphatase [Candidatus Methylacidiphilales bacterium]